MSDDWNVESIRDMPRGPARALAAVRRFVQQTYGGKLMTESDWLASTDPAAMLAWLIGSGTGTRQVSLCGISGRNLRLFACACCRQVWDGVVCSSCGGSGRFFADRQLPADRCPACRGTGRTGGLTDPRSRRAIEVAERLADGEAMKEDVVAARVSAILAFQESEQSFEKELVTRLFGPVSQLTENAGLPRWFSVSTKFAATQAALLRDLMGNPWRPWQCRCDAEVGHYCEWCEVRASWCLWNNCTVPRMAAAIYQERRWEDMPILADALEDSGATDPDILAHCRSGDPHARGCWVVDLLLGKS